MEAIHILAIVNSLYDFLLVNMLRQGQLHDKAIYIGIVVEFVHTCQQLIFRHVVFKTYQGRFEATSLTCQHLVFHVCFRTTIMAHQHGCQVGLLASGCHYLLHFCRYLGLDLCRCSFSVYQLHDYCFIDHLFLTNQWTYCRHIHE